MHTIYSRNFVSAKVVRWIIIVMKIQTYQRSLITGSVSRLKIIAWASKSARTYGNYGTAYAHTRTSFIIFMHWEHSSISFIGLGKLFHSWLDELLKLNAR